MHGQRLLAAVGAVVTFGVISVPAQDARRLRPATVARPAAREAKAPLPPTVLAHVNGSALSAASEGLPHVPVRLRDARYGRIVRTLTTDTRGFFAFRGVDPGSYVVELLDDGERVLAASQLVSLNAAEVASVTVREPVPVTTLVHELGQANSHAAPVRSAAAAAGILATRPPKDDVSPR